MVREKLLDKLAKLKAHAESAEEIGNEKEAEAFAEMLQELCIKHKIAMNDLERIEENHDEPVAEHPVDFAKHGMKVKHSRIAWQQHLAGVVARAHFCRILVHRRSNKITMVGRQSDAAVAEYVFVTLARAIDKLANKAHGKYYRECFKRNATWEAKNYKSSYKEAFVRRISQRFDELKEKMSNESSQALVIVKNADAAVEDFMGNQNYGNSKALSRHRNNNADGAVAGREAANKINLGGKGIDAGHSPRHRIEN